MIITKLCIILVIFAKHCDPLAPYLPAVGLQFTTAGHAMYLELFKWPNDERSQLETERPKIRKSRKKSPDSSCQPAASEDLLYSGVTGLCLPCGSSEVAGAAGVVCGPQAGPVPSPTSHLTAQHSHELGYNTWLSQTSQ